jgi:hypothetical protein
MGQTHIGFKPACVGSGSASIIECKIMFITEHRAQPLARDHRCGRCASLPTHPKPFQIDRLRSHRAYQRPAVLCDVISTVAEFMVRCLTSMTCTERIKDLRWLWHDNTYGTASKRREPPSGMVLGHTHAGLYDPKQHV